MLDRWEIAKSSTNNCFRNPMGTGLSYQSSATGGALGSSWAGGGPNNSSARCPQLALAEGTDLANDARIDPARKLLRNISPPSLSLSPLMTGWPVLLE